jgi:Tol biopolymer transport system component
MDSDGTNPRKIAATEKPDEPLGGRIWPVVWSPGGQRIAYIESQDLALLDPEEDRFSLQTRDANGGDPQVVLNDTRLKQALSWVADGRILFAYREDPTSERSNDGVYSIRVDERTGKATSQPQTVTSGQGRVGGLSVTSDGKQPVLWRENTQPQAFIAEFEAVSRRLKTPRRLTLDANGNIAEAWTSDSKAVLLSQTGMARGNFLNRISMRLRLRSWLRDAAYFSRV